MNVILLTVDSLRWDRISRNGYERPLTPEMDEMMSRALVCNATYAMSSSTTGSFPSIMTSTRPMSYGGFDQGVLNRPPTISNALSKAGYEVTHLSTVPWINSYLGYSRGVDEDHMLYSFPMLARCGTPLMRLNIGRYVRGEISVEELHRAGQQVLPGYFTNLRQYCEMRRRERSVDPGLRNCLYGVQTYRWDSLRRTVERWASELECDPAQFWKKVADHFAKTERWVLDADWRRHRSLHELAGTAIGDVVSKALKPLNNSWASRLTHRHKHSIDAEAIVNRIIKSARDAKSRGRRSFIWSHLFDAHIPFTAGSGSDWMRDSKNWLRKAGHAETIDYAVARNGKPRTESEWKAWSALYDAAVCYIDHHVGRLRKELERSGLSDTLIVVSSDHGEELGEHGDNSHRWRLYEHNVRVHAMYFHPDFSETRVPGLSTLMDLAPTIADLASIERPAGWEGASLTSLKNQPREEVVLENTFGSPSDARYSPIYLAVRRGKFKLMYNETVDLRDPLSHTGAKLFDLDRDPVEQKNVIDVYPEEAQSLLFVARARLNELRANRSVAYAAQ